MVKDAYTTSPDSAEATVNNIPCDTCDHPKSFHRQKKYYCLAEVIYNDPQNNNEPIKAMCSCTKFVNAQAEAKEKKDREDKENQKEKDKEKQKPIEVHPAPQPVPKQDKQETIPLVIEQPTSQGGLIHS